jgi:hypothetical protein
MKMVGHSCRFELDQMEVASGNDLGAPWALIGAS